MITLMFLTTIMIVAILFLQMKHPLAMGLTLLFQTISIAIYTGLSSPSFWYAYILYLIFLGGMLVLFIYVTSLASNEMFSISSLSIITSLSMFLISLILAWTFQDLLSTTLINTFDSLKLEMSVTSSPENLNLLLKLYNTPNNTITLMLITYLLFSLIVVVAVTKKSTGPLRPMN